MWKKLKIWLKQLWWGTLSAPFYRSDEGKVKRLINKIKADTEDPRTEAQWQKIISKILNKDKN